MSDAIERLNAALEGRYRIERELGEGGMATVYLADDLKHERKVALKVLKPELAAVVGAERFLAEIKTTANLQHPHILPLFDSGEADSFLFFVMPYVEGETLGDRIEREKQLPVDEAVRITVAIAGALQHAHERGVIHRDIKPANILMQRGQPFIADFGIALAVGAAGGSRLTETGLSIGTPFYMSPEQATGDHAVGPPSDIYAMAAVLYEMLTGEPPYTGTTAQAVLSKIIQGEPVSASSIRHTVPPHVDGAIRKALEKLPADRFANADAFGRALTDESFRYGAGTDEPAASRTATPAPLVVGAVTVAAIAGLLAGVLLPTGRGSGDARVITSELTLGPDLPPLDLRRAEVSADGAVVVYGALDAAGVSELLVRGLDESTARHLPGTSGAWSFEISPAGDEVAFTGIAVGPLRVVSLEGGGSRTLTDRAQGTPVWGDRYVYFMNADFGISRVPITGGDVADVTPSSDEPVFRFPDAVLPGGEALLFTESGVGGSRPRVGVLEVESGEMTYVTDGARSRYRDGVLVFSGVAGDQLLAAGFDPESYRLTTRSLVVVSGLRWGVQMVSAVEFSLGTGGDLVYPSGGSATLNSTTPVWVDRDGNTTPIDREWRVSPTVSLTGLDLSHDGSRLAVANQGDESTIDIWVKDLRGGPAQRLSFDPPTNTRPFWGPDDASIYYFRDPEGGYVQGELLVIPADGSGVARLVRSGLGLGSGSWRPGHEWMIYRVGVPAHASRDIFAWRAGDAEPVELIATAATEQAPSLSPDGRWLVYQSDRSGEHNVFVRPFPNVDGGLTQISLDGGSEPQWAPSGDEIFYRNLEGSMVAARVESGAGLRAVSHEVLFDASPYWSDPAAPQYDVAPDGQRFLMLEREPGNMSLVVVWNWLEGVKARLGEEGG